jgi:hypothetical protein
MGRFGQVHVFLSFACEHHRLRSPHKSAKAIVMGGLALVMFLALFGFGDRLLGWSDVSGNVQLGLFLAFILGIICGYRTAK